MNNIKLKYYYLLMPIVCSIILTQCKSAEFTFLGFFKKKYEKVVVTTEAEIISKDTTLTISGIVSDSLNNPIENVEIYLIRDSTIEYHTVTTVNGSYTIKNVAPDTYYFYLISPLNDNLRKEFYELKRGKDTNQINFIL